MQKDILFIKACQDGQKGVVASFLKSGGIHVNRKDDDGLTALHYACRKGSKDIVKLLIENGAEVNSTSNIGSTPLHMAVWPGVRTLSGC